MKKTTQLLCLLLPCLLFLSSCGGLDMSRINVGPENTISWDDAVTVITEGDVDYVYQTHDLNVRINMEDGTKYLTTEPDIDEAWRVIKATGRDEEIRFMTQ